MFFEIFPKNLSFAENPADKISSAKFAEYSAKKKNTDLIIEKIKNKKKTVSTLYIEYETIKEQRLRLLSPPMRTTPIRILT